MSTATISSADRLSLTLFLAVVVHALVILGIGFTTAPERKHESPPLIEVTLAEQPSEERPDDYDFLAQADQDGGGVSEEAQRPQQQARPELPGLPEGANPLQAAPAPTPPPQAQREELVATEQAPEQAPPPEPVTTAPQPEPTQLDLLSASRQVARSSEFLEDRATGLPRFPSKRRIDARTRAHAAAAYMHEWVGKVERVGNLNYPEEARRRNLSGRLVLEVTLRPDGHLHEMRILQPSRHPALDQAAMRIVELAAPFGAVPAEVLEGNDLLVIVRTWEFLPGRELQAR